MLSTVVIPEADKFSSICENLAVQLGPRQQEPNFSEQSEPDSCPTRQCPKCQKGLIVDDRLSPIMQDTATMRRDPSFSLCNHDVSNLAFHRTHHSLAILQAESQISSPE
jgi:hypothetical protein